MSTSESSSASDLNNSQASPVSSVDLITENKIPHIWFYNLVKLLLVVILFLFNTFMLMGGLIMDQGFSGYPFKAFVSWIILDCILLQAVFITIASVTVTKMVRLFVPVILFILFIIKPSLLWWVLS